MAGSSVIGALRVSLGLDSAQFSNGARQAQSQLADMKKTFLAVTGVAIALGTALSAAALKGAADIDKTAKAARRLGTSIGGYRALEMAAGEAGVTVEMLADSMQTLDREVAKGGKAAVGALGQLGLAAADLDGKDADQKLALIADRVKELGLSTGEASAILQGLGIRNREMILAVMAGGDALRAARADVADYGLAISSVDAKRIEAANDAINRLGLIGQYAGQQLAIALVPAMGALAQAMTDSLREGGFLRMVIDGIVGNLDILASTLGVVVAYFGVSYVGALAMATLSTFTFVGALAALKAALITTGIGALIVGAGVAVAMFLRLVEGAGSFGKALGLLADVTVEVWQRIGDGAQVIVLRMREVSLNMQGAFLSALAIMQDGWAGFLRSIAGGVSNIPGMEGLADELGTAAILAQSNVYTTRGDADFANEKASNLGGQADVLADSMGRPLASIKALRDAVTQTATELDAAVVSSTNLGNALEDAGGGGGGGGGGGKGGKAIDALKDKAENLKQKMEEVRGAMSSAFVGLVTGAKSLKGAIGELLGKFAEMLASSAFDALWGGMGSGGKKGTGIAGFIGGLFGFANGTNSAPGGMALVGERGPELVNLPRGSQVNTAQETKALLGGGGGSVSISIDARGAQQGVAEQIAQQLQRAMPGITNAVRAGIGAKQARGYGV
jgi:hypothetical protein